MQKLFFLILAPLLSFGQFESISFTGIIQTADSVVFPYEIHLSRIGGTVSGYSISDKGGAAETKSILETRKVNNQLYFKINWSFIDYNCFFTTIIYFYLNYISVLNIIIFNKNLIGVI